MPKIENSTYLHKLLNCRERTEFSRNFNTATLTSSTTTCDNSCRSLQQSITLKRWSSLELSMDYSFEKKHKGPIKCMDIDSMDVNLLSGGLDGSLSVYSLSSLQPLQKCVIKASGYIKK
jgi:WD40 repeat protein